MNTVCQIIGVLENGMEGLTAPALASVRQADVVIGGTRMLKLFADQFCTTSKQFDLTKQLTTVPNWIKQAQAENKSVVVLATGDPLCHGIASYLMNKLGQASCVVVPNLSTVQLLCARFGFTWQDIKVCSVHNKDTGEWISGADKAHGLYSLLQAVVEYDRLAVFTSPENDPARIARMLQLEGMTDAWHIYVAENLLTEHEQLYDKLSIDAAAIKQFAAPNIVLLVRDGVRKQKPLFGLADDNFKQRKPDMGLITKREVRAVSLARLQLVRNSIVWDIGAGSGAVGLEAARLCPQGHVYAIEKNEADAAIALENKKALNCTNYTLLHDKAPAQLDNWPSPNAIFIGGSGGELAELIRLCLQRLKPPGWLVMNFVTIENLALAVETLKTCNMEWDVTQLGAARSQPILHMQRMAAENPVWIISAQANNSNNP